MFKDFKNWDRHADTVDTVKLWFKPFLWKYFALLTLPTYLIAKLDSGGLFFVFIFVCCIYSRSGKLGGYIGWFIVTLTVFIFYYSPEYGHFIENVLLKSVWGSAPTAEYLHNNIPDSFSEKLSAAFFLDHSGVSGL